MKYKPILFSTPMVRAILKGRKSQTRRVIKPQYAERSNGEKIPLDVFSKECDLVLFAPHQPGDILWVRETWGTAYTYGDKGNHGKVGMYVYLADGDTLAPTLSMKWRPSIHMPREAARIFLRVIDVRAERVQEISEADAEAEGIGDLFQDEIAHSDKPIYNIPVDWNMKNPLAICQYELLWDSLNAKRDGGIYAWDKNPWVWVYTFEHAEKPANWPTAA